MNNHYAVIMAGGVGSRFWPVSTKKYPKQFHDMLGTGTTLIQQTFNRLRRFIPPSQIYIATNARYKQLVLDQLGVSENQLLIEPAMRNTAPCILYAALKIEKINPAASILIAPSDHWIENEDEFEANIKTAFHACDTSDILMTLGIQPTHPNTGYGYIKFKDDNSTVKKVEAFVEKPDLAKATKYLNEGGYVWNAGIFIWSVKAILKAFTLYLPAMKSLFDKGNDVFNTPEEAAFIEEHYEDAENISIDYGIMQKATNIFTLPVHFDWNDLGTWSSLYEKIEKDAQQNAVINASSILLDAKNNIVRTNAGKKVIIQGLSDFIVVEKDDVLLICPKSKEQEIKGIVAKVKEKYGSDLG
ncbi:mannose-1-phosphate guanylyltransferase [Flavobacteriaceae bacterium F08102]|nr:mannose-1-phosphate guanylyltransferase [Flavobacteriaceae bacterium F08102]